MGYYDFETITAAEALAYNRTLDELRTTLTGNFTVTFDDVLHNVVISHATSNHSVVFGPGIYGEFIYSSSYTPWIYIGSPDRDFVGGWPGPVYTGSGRDVISTSDMAFGGPGSDTFISGPTTRIMDWESIDRLSMALAEPTTYVETTKATIEEALAFAKTEILAGTNYIVVAVGNDLQVFADYQDSNNVEYISRATIIGRNLNDISIINFSGGPAPTSIYSAKGSMIGNMDSQQLSSLVGATIAVSTPTNFYMSLNGIYLSLTGRSFIYDSSGQIIGGYIDRISYYKSNFSFTFDTDDLSAANIASWVSTNATQLAFSTILAGDDSIAGSPFGAPTGPSDLIRGYAGDDFIFGGGGFDSLFGGTGDDTIYAEFPPLIGGGGVVGPDYLRGEDGNDTLIGGRQGDDIDGGTGDDRLTGGEGNDVLNGGPGSDVAGFTGPHVDAWVRSYVVGGSIRTEVRDQAGAEGLDTLNAIEALSFKGASFALAGVQQNHLAVLDASRFDDVLIQTSNGLVAYVDMNGTAGTGGLKTIFGALPAGWAAVGSGDFTSDGRAEVIIQNTGNGAIYYYGAGSWGTVSASLTSDWQFKGVGDFTMDGALDVLIRNQVTGYNMIAEMDGARFGAWMLGPNLGTGWRTVGVGDFDKDGYSDILVQNLTDGTTYYANMDNGVLAGWGFVAGGLGTNWIAKETVDLNADGYFDVVFQNTASGDVWFVDMAGGSQHHWGVVAALPGWMVEGSGDYDNDGYGDVLVRNLADGRIYYANIDAGVFNGWGVAASGLGTGWVAV